MRDVIVIALILAAVAAVEGSTDEETFSEDPFDHLRMRLQKENPPLTTPSTSGGCDKSAEVSTKQGQTISGKGPLSIPNVPTPVSIVGSVSPKHTTNSFSTTVKSIAAVTDKKNTTDSKKGVSTNDIKATSTATTKKKEVPTTTRRPTTSSIVTKHKITTTAKPVYCVHDPKHLHTTTRRPHKGDMEHQSNKHHSKKTTTPSQKSAMKTSTTASPKKQPTKSSDTTKTKPSKDHVSGKLPKHNSKTTVSTTEAIMEKLKSVSKSGIQTAATSSPTTTVRPSKDHFSGKPHKHKSTISPIKSTTERVLGPNKNATPPSKSLVTTTVRPSSKPHTQASKTTTAATNNLNKAATETISKNSNKATPSSEETTQKPVIQKFKFPKLKKIWEVCQQMCQVCKDPPKKLELKCKVCSEMLKLAQTPCGFKNPVHNSDIYKITDAKQKSNNTRNQIFDPFSQLGYQRNLAEAPNWRAENDLSAVMGKRQTITTTTEPTIEIDFEMKNFTSEVFDQSVQVLKHSLLLKKISGQLRTYASNHLEKKEKQQLEKLADKLAESAKGKRSSAIALIKSRASETHRAFRRAQLKANNMLRIIRILANGVTKDAKNDLNAKDVKQVKGKKVEIAEHYALVMSKVLAKNATVHFDQLVKKAKYLA